MRRAILAVALGGVLLTGAACDSDAQKPQAVSLTPGPSVAPASAGPDYSADTKAVCDKLREGYNHDLEAFAAQVGRMIADKEAKKPADAAKAQKAASALLRAAGAKLRAESAKAQDPEIRTAGATSAAKFVRSADDAAFFNRIKSTKDLNKAIDAQMAEWLTPVAGYCA